MDRRPGWYDRQFQNAADNANLNTVVLLGCTRSNSALGAFFVGFEPLCRGPPRSFHFDYFNLKGALRVSKVNLRELYPFYCEDCYIDVSDSIVKIIREMERSEEAYMRKVLRYKAYYSLDRADNIECDAVVKVVTPEEYYEKKVISERLYEALGELPLKQVRRIYAHYYLHMNFSSIAKIEGVRYEVIRESIQAGLKALAKRIKDFD